jgi:2-methylcitrate dehydratase PrpD
VADDLTAKYPGAWPVRLTLMLSDRTRESAASDYPRGNAENPVSTAALEQKLAALVGGRFGDEAARAALSALRGLECAGDLAAVFSRLPIPDSRIPR